MGQTGLGTRGRPPSPRRRSTVLGDSIDMYPFGVLTISMDDFMKIEDLDLQKYLLINHGVVRSRTEVKMTDDDDKKGWWMIDYVIKQNNQGKPYLKSSVKQYIVYDKKTKKARVSPIHRNLILHFLKEYFEYPEILINHFIWKLTPTLCKKIVEEKISCIEDIIKYHRSYTIKRKELSLETLYKFIVWKGMGFLHVIEDPENIINESELSKIPPVSNFPFKFKTEEIPEIGRKYERWTEEQNKKYDTFLRQRNEGNGTILGKKWLSQGTNVSYQLSTE